MHCERKISDGFYYVGSSDRRLALFENVYPIPNGVSYNSYLYLDEQTLLLDTVDSSVSDVFYENIDFLLNGRKLDYLIVNHMEPDHAANIGELALRHPSTTIVVNAMSKKFLFNYFPEIKNPIMVVKEGDKLNIGKHTFTFVMAPMVHWPEVMFTFELSEGVLFSADAFGTFGALEGDIFASSSTFTKSFLAEARRYYTNIVGKYGDQVVNVLKKASTIDIKMICPLHGPLYKGNLNFILNPYMNWATYAPEENDAVMICYSSVYGGTKNAVEVLAKMLSEKGMKNLVVYDVSKTDSSYLIAEAFRVKTIVLASTTYNAGVFVKMEEFLTDLAEHKIRNRTFAFLENGSWAPAARLGMKNILKDLQGSTFIEDTLTLTSRIKENQLEDLSKLADAVASSVILDLPSKKETFIDDKTQFKLTYGLFSVFSKDENGKIDGSINNSFFQISDSPNLFLLSVNKANYTAENIKKTGRFVVSILNNETDYALIKRFGFASGRDSNKLEGAEDLVKPTSSGLVRLDKMSNGYLDCEVKQTLDIGNHVVFIAEVKESRVLNNSKSLTYEYYFANIKPKALPSQNKVKKTAWVCRICGYTYVGETLPVDFICPLCKHPASDFDKVEL